MELTPHWEYVADTVMGGVSTGKISSTMIDGRSATQLGGRVSLENNGGFIQMAFDLLPDGRAFDASEFRGVEIDVFGNCETYELRLRTDQLTRPWQSFRVQFVAASRWASRRFEFDEFEPHRTETKFDPARLRRLGIVAIGKEFEADIAVSAIRLFK